MLKWSFWRLRADNITGNSAKFGVHANVDHNADSPASGYTGAHVSHVISVSKQCFGRKRCSRFLDAVRFTSQRRFIDFTLV